MATPDLLDSLFHFPPDNLSKKEKFLLEMVLFTYLHQELTDYFKVETSINKNKEYTMTNYPIIRGIVNDLLTNDEYSLQGLADYTGYPEEVIYDVAIGINSNPTLVLSTKIIELHALAHRDFYTTLVKKVINKFVIE